MPFPEPLALEIFYGICEGVMAVHTGGWMHRDIKPHNVLLDYSGGGGPPKPILMDLGSAVTLDSVRVETRHDAIMLQDEAQGMCSPPYRAPELTDVRVGVPVDARVDVFR